MATRVSDSNWWAIAAMALALVLAPAAARASGQPRGNDNGCAGDCDQKGSVSIDELVTGVNIALDNREVSDCVAFDGDGCGSVTVSELVMGVLAALEGCAATPTPTPTAPSGPTATVTSTATSTPTPTSTATPVSVPTRLAATIDGTQVRLTWTNADPASGNTRARLLRRFNAGPAGPDDVEAVVIFAGTASTAVHPLIDLLPDTPTEPRTYHYTVYGCTDGAVCEEVGSTTTLTPTVAQVLRGGGYTIYFRHGLADICADCTELGPAATTTFPDWWKSCEAICPAQGGCGTPGTATARQINDTGRTQSTTIGNGFRAQGFPVGRVQSSEFCRCIQTAELMDFDPPIETVQNVSFFVYGEENRCPAARELLAGEPPAGTNTVIIGHAGFSCDELGALGMGDGAIRKPDGAGGSTMIDAMVAPSEWATLP